MKLKYIFFLHILIIFFTFTIIGCNNFSSTSNSSQIFLNEELYCSNVNSVSGVAIYGQATYQARIIQDEASFKGLGEPGTAQPIRHAEIQVRNSNNQIIQCATTQSDGSFNLSLEKRTGTYYLRINSRSFNDYLKASVLDNPFDKNYHYIQKSFQITSSSTNIDIGTLNAPAEENLEGGAFNILDQLLNANEFLREKVTEDSCSTYCDAFTVAPKINIYWKKGINVNTYFGGTDPLSFFISDQNNAFGIYILGGENGDVDFSDTDHFDNSIILHEYAHFLEYTYSQMSSPGGIHNGDLIIDPRLAWSEGWANFFQAAVQGLPQYKDTYGNIDGLQDVNSAYLVDINIEDNTLNNPQIDIPVENGEGVYREFSITRALWDLFDTNSEPNDDVNVEFVKIWAIFAGKNNGLAEETSYYNNIGLFYEHFLNNFPAIDISTIYTAEKQNPVDRDYAITLSTSNETSCPVNKFSIQGLATYVPKLGYYYPQFHKSNDFFPIVHPGGSLSLNIYYTQTDASIPSDLDLYLYKHDYIYFYEDSVIDYSALDYDTQESGEESIYINNLSAGHYMINIKAKDVDGYAVDYCLKYNNTWLYK